MESVAKERRASTPVDAWSVAGAIAVTMVGPEANAIVRRYVPSPAAGDRWSPEDREPAGAVS
jgi:hypothetical protein